MWKFSWVQKRINRQVIETEASFGSSSGIETEWKQRKEWNGNKNY